jgi:uncharacterized protein YbcV (DUF1398 family)
MNRTIIDECHVANFSDRDMPFPDVARRVAGAGVRFYRADLLRLETTWYDSAGETHTTPLPLADAPAIAMTFSAPEVVAALRAVQSRQIDYREFLRRIMRAGATSYCVFLRGRRAMYFGQDGDVYVEGFPDALQIPELQAA